MTTNTNKVDETGNLILTEEILRARLIPINEFQSITPEAAELLAKHRSHCDSSHNFVFDFASVSEITPEVACLLAKGTSYRLCLNKLTELNDQVALALTSTNGTVELNGLTELTDATAEALSRIKGDLELNGIQILRDSAAKYLACHKGKLSLSGVKTLTPTSARHLSRYDGELSLYGLAELSDDAALALGTSTKIHCPKVVSRRSEAVKNRAAQPSALTSKQQATVKKMADSIDADNLKTAVELLNSSQADEADWLKIFGKSRVKKLLATWNPQIWNLLASPGGQMSVYWDLLAEEAQQRLNSNSSDPSAHWKISWFIKDYLATASESGLVLLGGARDNIKVSLENADDSSIERALKLSCMIKGSFPKFSDTDLHRRLAKKCIQGANRWTENGKEIPDTIVEILCDIDGDLYLDELVELSTAAAISLSRHKGQLYLPCVETLSVETAEALSRRKEGLLKIGCRYLSDTATQILAKSESDQKIFFAGLQQLSDASARSWSESPAKWLAIRGLKDLSEDAARALCTRRDYTYIDCEHLSESVNAIFNSSDVKH